MTLNPSRIALLVALAIVLFLSGCQHLMPGSGVQRAMGADDVALRAILAYARTQAEAEPAARAAEMRSIENGPHTPIQLMKLAILLGQNRPEAEPAKGVGVLEKVIEDNSADAALFHPLARLLHAQYLARVRLSAQNERLVTDYHDARNQMDELQKKLDALTDIERSLPAPTRTPMERNR
ncbi:hypothetical protein G3580_10265 [Nitrogeniibacter mangrovi]|uniref:Uncharacterized protein n=1 Tax=Nitrogeniibacter mangrovi TaxID=2016596 RepID=A0A6C1B2W3_9RHOO|nr:hypothetical protein [Nitrogeniibacter mangrovi]QID17991.1 hypothetical protein G3580_10265 [Nitrogeniibacter mangrovi]